MEGRIVRKEEGARGEIFSRHVLEADIKDTYVTLSVNHSNTCVFLNTIACKKCEGEGEHSL